MYTIWNNKITIRFEACRPYNSGLIRRAISGENLILLRVNNNGADQLAHPCSLICTFDIHSPEDILATLVTCTISRFSLVSVAEQAGFNLNSAYPDQPIYSPAQVQADDKSTFIL